MCFSVHESVYYLRSDGRGIRHILSGSRLPEPGTIVLSVLAKNTDKAVLARYMGRAVLARYIGKNVHARYMAKASQDDIFSR